MKLKPCTHCAGAGGYHQLGEGLVMCYICEGTGTIPDEPVSHCQACGEPVEVGLEWCQLHRPAADLWQALNQEQSNVNE